MDTPARFRLLIELALVFAVMLSVKWLADHYDLIGAGGIAIWCAILVATFVLRRSGTSWASLGLTFPTGLKDWATTIGIALGAVVAVVVIMGLVLTPIFSSLGIDTPSDAGDRFEFFLGKPFVFLAFLFVVVWFGAAFGEEILMRGFLLNHLADFFGRSRVAIFVALFLHAGFFGLLHAYQGIPGIVGTAVVALIFGSIYLLTGRKLAPVILGHGILNTISLTGYYLTNGAMT